MDNFIFKRKINTGSQGTVYLVEERFSSRTMACKVLMKNKRNSCNEITFLKKYQNILHHTCLLPILGTFETSDTYFVITPFLKGGDLLDLINCIGPLDEQHACVIFVSILGALMHLHSHNIMHRDIKPENILFQDEECLEPILADYGGCCITYTGWAKGRCGTRAYMAPEVRNHNIYSKNIDFFSLGCTLYTMLRAKIPFNPEKPKFTSSYAFNIFDTFWDDHPVVFSLLKGLLVIDPTKRFTLTQITNHSFITNIHFPINPPIFISSSISCSTKDESDDNNDTENDREVKEIMDNDDLWRNYNTSLNLKQHIIEPKFSISPILPSSCRSIYKDQKKFRY